MLCKRTFGFRVARSQALLPSRTTVQLPAHIATSAASKPLSFMIPAYKKEMNGHAASPGTPSSFYYGDEDIRPPAPEDVEEKLKRAQKTAVGHVADLISQEVEERRRMIGGIDNFWLMLSDITDFNPVRGKQCIGGPSTRLTAF